MRGQQPAVGVWDLLGAGMWLGKGGEEEKCESKAWSGTSHVCMVSSGGRVITAPLRMQPVRQQ